MCDEEDKAISQLVCESVSMEVRIKAKKKMSVARKHIPG